jgi:polyphosphate glucokinase
MNVLMIDVGGTNVKIMASYEGEMRKMPSGEKLSASEMVRGVIELASGLEYDRISLGYPGLVHSGMPVREPNNLGSGWVGLDYSKAFGKPVRIINDAAMQALGNYTSGRLLFLGFGTSIGAAMIVDDIVVPIEVGLIKLTRKTRLMDRVSQEALDRDGREAWMKAVAEGVEIVDNIIKPDKIILGGGNSDLIDPLPEKCRRVDNRSAYMGAQRLWEGSDLFASACPTSWRIHRDEAHE